MGGVLDIRLEKAIYELQETVEEQQARTRVDEINVAAFGFSRGATQARAFLNWLAEHSKISRRGDSLTYDGIPLNVKFLGLFDTVESVGGAGTNRQPELVKTSVPPFVQKCLHIVAAQPRCRDRDNALQPEPPGQLAAGRVDHVAPLDAGVTADRPPAHARRRGRCRRSSR